MNIIIDTGCANLSSVRFAIERLGNPVEISADPDKILAADKVFLPGVGTVESVMTQLREKQLVDVIIRIQAPVLGICLGMQILAMCSYEGGAKVSSQSTACLGLIPGEIQLIDAQGLPLPHMGWNQITPVDHPLFKEIPAGSFFYFVHSYAWPVNPYTLAQCEYGQPFSAAIQCDNFIGVQFHPERSGQIGAKLLQNFLEL